MVQRKERPALDTPLAAGTRTFAQRLLIIEARYYQDVADHLLAGALDEINAQGAKSETWSVPGALEIPQALAQAIGAGLIGRGARSPRFQGVVALGCVIRGETSHYDIVCNNANHWLMECAIHHTVPLGNAILTVDTREQALKRATGGRKGKGGDAARACLGLLDLAAQSRKERAL